MTTFHAYYAMIFGKLAVVVRFPDSESKSAVIGDGDADEVARQLAHKETGLPLEEINVEIATATMH